MGFTFNPWRHATDKAVVTARQGTRGGRMPPQPITPEDIEHRFTNHPPVAPGAAEALDSVTATMIVVGSELVRLLPPGREASLAITNLEQASMWAKAAIARSQAPPAS